MSNQSYDIINKVQRWLVAVGVASGKIFIDANGTTTTGTNSGGGGNVKLTNS